MKALQALSPTAERFILHWGEMGTRWGINRSVAQIHALLYISEKPLNAEQITATLSLARSNVSTSLRELQSWGLVKTVHLLGDRRDYFETMEDVWEMFHLVLEERKRREIDPTLEMLREGVQDTRATDGQDAYGRDRLAALLEFMEIMSQWYEQLCKLPRPAQIKFLKMGGKVAKLLGASR